jgi:uncharacterized membrane-anchored protein YhcB (DUF1043 family)
MTEALSHQELVEQLEDLEKQLKERDEQVVKAAGTNSLKITLIDSYIHIYIEIGQHLVHKNKSLENRIRELKEENRTLTDQLEDVQSSLEFLKNELSSTENVSFLVIVSHWNTCAHYILQ